MRRTLLLLISVGLNIFFVAAWVSIRRHPVTVPVVSGYSQNVVTNQAQAHVVVRKQFFSWHELESAEYQTYIANLRDIGCPEQTIRDIIIADVNQIYLKRRWAEVPTPDQEWWRAEPDTNFVQNANAKLAALEQERRALLASLLGPNWEAGDAVPPAMKTLNGPVLGQLSPEAKNAVQDIIARSQQRTQAYLDTQKAAGRTPSPADLEHLDQQMRNELAQVLSPTQLEEFLLRYSQTAATLRDELRGVEVSADQFRSLFRATDPLEQQLQLINPNAPDTAAQQTAIAKQMVDSLKSSLGTQLYQQFRMASDPAYRDAVNLANDVGASADAVPGLYALNRALGDESNRIRNDPNLTDDQKAAQLQAAEDQAQQASDQLLGLAPATPPVPPIPTPPPPAAVHAYSPGETVDMIAAQYGVSTSSIMAANPNLNFNALVRGTPINIPADQ